MTTNVAEVQDGTGEFPGWPKGPQRQYYGHVIIEWPAPLCKDGTPRALAGWGCSILDAATGKPITTAEKISIPAISADAQSFITCELVMFADLDGMPVMGLNKGDSFKICKAGDRIRTGVFPFLVAEMRVRS